MSSKYQMWLTHNGGTEKIRLPVLPSDIKINVGGKNTSVDIVGLGEIVIRQDRPAISISFSSFFPKAKFPGIQVSSITAPQTLKNKVLKFKNSNKPSKIIVTGTDISMYCSIEKFDYSEQGGDVGTLYYSLTLKEDRAVAARKIKIDSASKKATLPANTSTRTDNRETPKTYTVVKGDCLWNISKKFLKSGSRWREIYNLNKDKIKNPNLIYPGQVLKLPT